MPRTYHSASSATLGARCRRAYAYCYIDGLRAPEVSWADIQAGKPHLPAQRSPALGTAVHKIGEAYYGPPEARAKIDWFDLPGQIYHSGIPWLPQPGAMTALVEASIGVVDLPPSPHAHAPTTALEVEGVLWGGFRDLVLIDPYLMRGGDWPAPELKAWHQEGTLLVDYKTTSSIAKWAKTPSELLTDLQHALYTIDVSRRYGIPWVASRWLYLETGSRRRAHPVDVEQRVDDAYEVVAPFNRLVRELDQIDNSLDAPCNPAACDQYRGCEYHSRVGGPCPAVESVWASVPVQVRRKDRPMISSSTSAKFKVAKAKIEEQEEAAQQALPGVDTNPGEAPVDGRAEAIEAAAEVTNEAPEKRIRKPRAPAKAAPVEVPAAAPAPVEVPAGTELGKILDLNARIADAAGRLGACKAELAALVAELKEIFS